ncbi:MAG: hypothetical protein FJ128_03850 [Deltaproteobacteria bacterium]|nr:hypothetical protein [Deltaproteobacteria bacterium]
MQENELLRLINAMEPEEALRTLAGLVKRLLALLGEAGWFDFVQQLAGDAATDKVASMVHL